MFFYCNCICLTHRNIQRYLLVYGALLKIFLSLKHHKLLNFTGVNFVEFVEKYQQDMTPEQMLSISKAIGKYISCKLSDAE